MEVWSAEVTRTGRLFYLIELSVWPDTDWLASTELPLRWRPTRRWAEWTARRLVRRRQRRARWRSEAREVR